MNFEPTRTDDHFDDSVGLSETLEKYLHYKKWFIISVIGMIILAFFKMRYEAPQYKVDAKILIKDKEKGQSVADLSEFQDFGLFGNSSNSLENEMEILKSRRLMTKVVEELKLNISYFIEDTPIDIEYFPNFPLVLNFKSDSANVNNISSEFIVEIVSEGKFQFFDHAGNTLGIKSFGENFKADLGNDIESDLRIISIENNKNFRQSLIGKKVKVHIMSVNSVVNKYLNKILIEPLDARVSKVLNISLNETIVDKGTAIINNLVEQYNADGNEDKDMVARATVSFLDDRLTLIGNELEAIETSAAQFKTNKGMIDATAGANIYLQTSSVAESELMNANTQLQLVNYMLDQLNRSAIGELLPGNIGLSDPSIVSMITSYNDLVLQRKRILKSSSEANPIIVNIDSQLSVLRNNLNGSLVSLRSSAQIQADAVLRRSGNISSKIASMPKYEKDYKDIVRDQETKNGLYLFLLQKREESILSNAVTIDKAKIIDKAYSDGTKISPKTALLYLAALLLGLLIPFLIIYLKEQLDTKVHTEKDLRKLRIPYLGDVPLSLSEKNLFIKDGDNSSIAEAFRYVRTNINFMLDSKNVGKTVFVTSTVAGEGKTFAAINLANSLAISGKKTILVGMDLRAPKLKQYLKIEGNVGVTHFIKDPTLKLDDIIQTGTNFEKLHLINSGEIPPNPVELLMSRRVKELFEELKKTYEFIIVDSAPVGMVTDTIQIAQFADLSIYVIKANFLDKRMLHIPEKLHKDNKLPNLALLINGSNQSKGAYGYGYGYHYGAKKKIPWFKKVFGMAAM